MSGVLVDTNVILDVINGGSPWSAWSQASLEAAGDRSKLMINPIIYGELSAGFATIEALEEAVPAAVFQREAIPYDAAFLAGKVFIEYRRRGGAKTSPLPDFIIGAHAAISGFQLLTRDAARYRTYFPGLALITPDLR